MLLKASEYDREMSQSNLSSRFDSVSTIGLRKRVYQSINNNYLGKCTGGSMSCSCTMRLEFRMTCLQFNYAPGLLSVFVGIFKNLSSQMTWADGSISRVANSLK